MSMIYCVYYKLKFKNEKVQVKISVMMIIVGD